MWIEVGFEVKLVKIYLKSGFPEYFFWVYNIHFILEAFNPVDSLFFN